MKLRIDELLVLKKLAPTRSQAKQLIMNGEVEYNGLKVTKPGQLVIEQGELKVGQTLQYVSRGAYKLEAAIKAFEIDPKAKIIADVGASTGGFTDYLLQHGASKIYCIDVGHEQLHHKLKNDPRVINIEKTNIRHPLELPEKTDLAVVDLSYISLRLTLQNIAKLTNGPIIALIKPQFEAGPGIVGSDGVIKDPAQIKIIIQEFKDWCSENGLKIEKIIPSPITGKVGNQESLALIYQQH